MSQQVVVGIDVSKEHLDLGCWPEGPSERYANSDAGIEQMLADIQPLAPELIVLEATGGYQVLAASTLDAHGLPVVVVNPRHARDFAKSIGQLAKTDKLDARGLARFGHATKPEIRPLPDADSQRLQSLVARRLQLVEMRVAELNRQQQTTCELVSEDIAYQLRDLDERIASLQQEIESMIKHSELWQERIRLLRTAKGVGPVLAFSLVANLPELGRLNEKEIAKLVGVAPLNCDSGKSRGKRKTWGGRAPVRNALYMPTLSAIRWNPPIREMNERLVAKGKPGLVAIVACMRKLLIVLNAMMRDQRPWQPNY